MFGGELNTALYQIRQPKKSAGWQYCMWQIASLQSNLPDWNRGGFCHCQWYFLFFSLNYEIICHTCICQPYFFFKFIFLSFNNWRLSLKNTSLEVKCLNTDIVQVWPCSWTTEQNQCKLWAYLSFNDHWAAHVLFLIQLLHWQEV